MTNRFMDGYDDPWSPTGRYGGKLVDWMVQSTPEWVSDIPLFKRTNPEGEKMEKIDWHKPLRAFKTPSHEVVDAKVYTYKSGRQRVVWIDDRVYPVDDQGRAVADVDYGPNWVEKGFQIVENVPEEKFFLGLARNRDGIYWLTDAQTEADIADYWAGLMKGTPHWVVDTRKAAEPPKAIEHDPKDWTVVRVYSNGATESFGLMTESDARLRSADGSVIAVRIRTTPAPADTARYIQLWRATENAPWRINTDGHGRQEFTWDETKHRGVSPTRAAIKVCD